MILSRLKLRLICHRIMVCSAVATLLLATSCSTLYVHDAGLEKLTASAKADFDKIKPETVFNNEASYLDALEKEEIAAIRNRDAALRDAEIILFLNGNDTLDGRTLFSARIDGYLKWIAGKPDRTNKVKFWRIVENFGLPENLEKDLQNFGAKIEDVPSVVALISPSGQELANVLKGFKDATADIADLDKKAKEVQKNFKSVLEEATRSLDPKSIQPKLKQILAESNKYLTNANPFIKKYVSESLAEGLQALIEATGPQTDNKTTSELTDDARAGLGFLQAAVGVGDAFSKPPRIPHPNALAVTLSWLQYMKELALLEIAERRLKRDVAEAKLEAVIAEVYFLSKAGEAFERVPTESPEGRKGLKDFLGKGKTANYAIAAALANYAEAWNRGFIRHNEIKHLEQLLERRAKLERSRRAGAAWVGLIKPGLETLASYGAGGIDPRAIANLLGALGLGAIAGGVN